MAIVCLLPFLMITHRFTVCTLGMPTSLLTSPQDTRILLDDLELQFQFPHSVSQELQLDALFTGVVLRDKGRFPGFHHPAGGAYRFLTVLGLKMKVRKRDRTVILPPDLLSLLINSSQVKASRFTLIHSTSTQDTGG